MMEVISDFNEEEETNIIQDEITFLPYPEYKKLNYLEKTIPLYANLYKIVISKSYSFYEYAIKFQATDIEISTKLKHKIIRRITKELSEIFDTFVLTGDTLFSTKQIKDVINKVIPMNKYSYSVFFQPTKDVIELNDNFLLMNAMYKKKPEVKSILEVIIKEILKHNPSLKFVKNLYGKKSEEKIASASKNYNNIRIMPGFTTAVMFLEEGIFLNVDIKNKILSAYDCLYLLNTFIEKKNNPTNQEIKLINDFFFNRIVETIHTSQRFKIEMVNFEKRAKNYEIKFESKNMPLIKYYKNIFDIDIDPESPLLLIKTKGKNEQMIGRYFPPQLCLLVGLTEDMLKDSFLLKNMVKEIKMCPDDKVSSIKDIIKLVNEKRGIKKIKREIDGTETEHVLASPYEKRLEYGIDIIDVTDKSIFTGSIIKNPTLISANNKTIPNLSKPFIVLEPKKINYLCIYHQLNEKEKKQMVDYMNKASQAYGLVIGKSDCKSINSENVFDWIKLIEKSLTNQHNIVIVLLDNYLKSLGFYQEIKTHSIEKVGYITQVISTESLYKNAMSIFSNILIQINSKIGGVSYKVQFDESITSRRLMIIGVDTSRLITGGKRKTLVAMCATTDQSLCQYTQKKVEIDDEFNGSMSLPISNYIIEALSEYFKLNHTFPGGLVIYRQGVSKDQKVLLTNEIMEIDNVLTGKSELMKDIKIPYYYILVNKKCSLKLFECDSSGRAGRSRKDNSSFDNPDPGLLVHKKMVDPLIFEFYIQPQKVCSGTATPTNFHVAYGNMNAPELVPKLTYDLCFLYSNWRGPVRVPAPLKYAEKLAKIEQKLNSRIKNTLSYI